MKVTNMLKLQFNEIIYGEGIESGIGIGRMVTGVISISEETDIVLQRKGSAPLAMIPKRIGDSYEAFSFEATNYLLENASDTLIIHMRGTSNRQDVANFIQKVTHAVEVCGSPTLKLINIEVSTNYDLQVK